ncbi:MAG: hypothetical protein K2H16_10090 [Prevotella sp.]|nr:hypothetical protein [Prevotella sp.]MDE6152459.1 hypothetical protein [Prevotella sp.]
MKTIAFINSTANKEFAEEMSCGEANGYVAVPPGHPLHGKDSVLLYDIDVHGGLTASAYMSSFMLMNDIEFISDAEEIPSDWWVFGFDTIHFNDKYSWSKERVKEETLRLQDQLEAKAGRKK